MSIESIVVCHFDEDGSETYHVFGDNPVRLFIVDERAPHDRVYEITSRADPAALRGFIPEGAEIGHCDDDRHAAIEARICAHSERRPFLNLVEASHEPD